MKLVKISGDRKIFKCDYQHAARVCESMGLGMHTEVDKEVITDAEGLYAGAFYHSWDDDGIGRLYICGE